MNEPPDRDDANAQCPKCGVPCRLQVILGFSPPDLSYWDCPKCGRLSQYDEAGLPIDHRPREKKGLSGR